MKPEEDLPSLSETEFFRIFVRRLGAWTKAAMAN